ncbi:10369_t:CDS:10 [Ambispora leptoticha]|uniref:Vacuolar import and degradation protein 21 n=1 Tax=Ambispora leptoticha TaxID=144679 RepID=A0A9N8VFH4_9GLOM|nr:10369_t:CDS:10 [Ambispora leptoticha]
MVTRAASGAICPKSVDEILKDAEKQNPPQRITATKHGDNRNNLSRGRARGYDRSAMISNFQNQPLYKSFQMPIKVLTSEDWRVARDEIKNVRVTEKIEQLKAANLWSFKQIEQHKAPPRTMTHWDYLLTEMKWLQTDFKEERRWKIAAHYLMAQWVMEWHDAEDKSTVCVKCRKPAPVISKEVSSNSMNIDTDNGLVDESREVKMELTEIKTEEIEEVIIKENNPDENRWQQNGHISNDEIMIDIESVDDETTSSIRPQNDLINNDQSTTSTNNITKKMRRRFFSLPTNQINFFLPDNQTFDLETILPECNIYGGIPSPSDKDTYIDEAEYARIIPISKTVVRRTKGYNNRKSMMQRRNSLYESLKRIKTKSKNDDLDDQALISPIFSKPNEKLATGFTVSEPPQISTNPTQSWSAEDDDLLLSLAKEYQCNWNLIAEMINLSRSSITGCIRNPYECHQRWLQREDTSGFIIQGVTKTSDDEDEIALGLVNSMDGIIVSGGSSSSTSSALKIKKDQLKKAPKFDPIKNNKRHSSIQEAIKKAAKKRQEEAQKRLQPKKVQEQPTSLQTRVPSPLELSRRKCEQERQAHQNILEARQAATLAMQGHHVRQPMNARPQPPQGVHMVHPIPQVPGRQPVPIVNQMQAYMLQQQRAAAVRVQQQFPQMTTQQAMVQAVQAQVQAAQVQATQAQQVNLQAYYTQLRAQQARLSLITQGQVPQNQQQTQVVAGSLQQPAQVTLQHQQVNQNQNAQNAVTGAPQQPTSTFGFPLTGGYHKYASNSSTLISLGGGLRCKAAGRGLDAAGRGLGT